LYIDLIDTNKKQLDFIQKRENTIEKSRLYVKEMKQFRQKLDAIATKTATDFASTLKKKLKLPISKTYAKKQELNSNLNKAIIDYVNSAKIAEEPITSKITNYLPSIQNHNQLASSITERGLNKFNITQRSIHKPKQNSVSRLGNGVVSHARNRSNKTQVTHEKPIDFKPTLNLIPRTYDDNLFKVLDLYGGLKTLSNSYKGYVDELAMHKTELYFYKINKK
jgi:hypothetical protein